jgi:hypothetical protein
MQICGETVYFGDSLRAFLWVKPKNLNLKAFTVNKTTIKSKQRINKSINSLHIYLNN